MNHVEKATADERREYVHFLDRQRGLHKARSSMEGAMVFGIHAPDGRLLGVAPDRDIAFAAARQHQLDPSQRPLNRTPPALGTPRSERSARPHRGRSGKRPGGSGRRRTRRRPHRSRLAQVSRPPWASAIWREMLSPRPEWAPNASPSGRRV